MCCLFIVRLTINILYIYISENAFLYNNSILLAFLYIAGLTGKQKQQHNITARPRGLKANFLQANKSIRNQIHMWHGIIAIVRMVIATKVIILYSENNLMISITFLF